MKALAVQNHGRWVVACPKCPSAEQVAPGQENAVCRKEWGGCGTKLDVVWSEGWQEAEQILADRPVENRNWDPEHETLEYLKGENALVGMFTEAVSEPAEGNSLIVVDGFVTPELAADKLADGYVLRFYDDDETTEVETQGKTEAQVAKLLKKAHKRVG